MQDYRIVHANDVWEFFKGIVVGFLDSNISCKMQDEMKWQKGREGSIPQS